MIMRIPYNRKLFYFEILLIERTDYTELTLAHHVYR